jgi:hypothetical protein
MPDFLLSEEDPAVVILNEVKDLLFTGGSSGFQRLLKKSLF